MRILGLRELHTPVPTSSPGSYHVSPHLLSGLSWAFLSPEAAARTPCNLPCFQCHPHRTQALGLEDTETDCWVVMEFCVFLLWPFWFLNHETKTSS